MAWGTRIAATTAAVAASGVLFGGCGTSGKSVTRAAPASLAVTEVSDRPNHYAFQGVHPIKAGLVNLTLTNTTKGPEHEAQLVRVDPPHTRQELITTLTNLSGGSGRPLPIPSWFHILGGASGAKSGQTKRTTQILGAGQYYVVDADSGDANNAPLFATQGGIAALKVSGPVDPNVDLPATTASVRVTQNADAAEDSADTFSVATTGLVAGDNRIQFDNRTKEFHHVVAFKLLPGKTPDELKTFLASHGPPTGPPPVDFKAGDSTAVVEGKHRQVTTLNLATPGNYVLVCFLSDRDGKGKPHFEQGFLKEVTLK